MSNIVKERNVIVLFTQASTREKFATSARTWGELQRMLKGDVSNKRCVVRETKNTLESSEAVLPEGDFVIFAYPKESKAGAKAAKKAKKAAKKVAKKKAAKKVAKKAAKKAAPKKKAAPAAKKEAVAKVVEAVASGAKTNEAVVKNDKEDMDALLNEAKSTKNTLPRY